MWCDLSKSHLVSETIKKSVFVQVSYYRSGDKIEEEMFLENNNKNNNFNLVSNNLDNDKKEEEDENLFE